MNFSSYNVFNQVSVRIRYIQQCYNTRGQIYGQDNDPVFHTVFLSTGQWPNITYINKECSISQHNICVYNMRTSRRISHFCDTLKMWNSGTNQRSQRIQRNQLSVLWNFSYPDHYPYPETSLTLGMPRAYPVAQYTAYPSGDRHIAQRGYPAAQGLREAALWPGDCPYSLPSIPSVP